MSAPRLPMNAAVGTSVPERFSDPLSAAMPDGAARARVRLRLAGALLFGAGSLTLAAVLAAPDPDTSDHAALTACAVVYGLVAAVLLLWRDPPAAVLHAICPGGTVAATAAVALSEPVGLTPIFYLWPMLLAAYFLGRREVAANLAFVVAACAVALALWVDPVLRLAMFLAVLAIVGVVTAVILVLREQVLALVMRLRQLASHDSLTGALNRGAFEQRLDAELARSRRTGTPLALVVFDVDHFKSINDRFGHAAGDDALRGIGDAVGGGLRRSDVFGRLGGEEFALLLPDTDMGGAAIVADKLRVRLSDRAAAGPALTVSFGVAEVTSDGGLDAREMFDEADRALYAAKRAGRDRVVRSDELRPRLVTHRPAY
jgi:diguanylate cyclase (GGDEF)-like protein